MCAALPGTKQLVCGSPRVATCVETWMRGGWDSCCTWRMRTSKRHMRRRVPSQLRKPQLRWQRHLHPCWKRGQASRLRELGAPIYGTKEYEHLAAKEEEYLESKRRELALATEPVTPKILPVQFNPLKSSNNITRSTTCRLHRGVSCVSRVVGRMTRICVVILRDNVGR